MTFLGNLGGKKPLGCGAGLSPSVTAALRTMEFGDNATPDHHWEWEQDPNPSPHSREIWEEKAPLGCPQSLRVLSDVTAALRAMEFGDNAPRAAPDHPREWEQDPNPAPGRSLSLLSAFPTLFQLAQAAPGTSRSIAAINN